VVAWDDDRALFRLNIRKLRRVLRTSTEDVEDWYRDLRTKAIEHHFCRRPRRPKTVREFADRVVAIVRNLSDESEEPPNLQAVTLPRLRDALVEAVARSIVSRAWPPLGATENTYPHRQKKIGIMHQQKAAHGSDRRWRVSDGARADAVPPGGP
jgi:hypothetical protein